MNIPRDKTVDSSLMLLLQGYRFLPSRFQKHQSDIFETRLMLQRVICDRGKDAAEMFYEPDRFTRHGALPPHTVRLLLDKGSVQMQEDEDHRYRKAMFMQLMTREHIEDLLQITSDEWRAGIEEWSRRSEVGLLDEVELLLCRAACAWAGVPLDEHAARTHTSEFSAMVTGARGVGPRTWKALFLRQRTERWVQGVIREIREGKRQPPESSAAYVIATPRDLSGELLPVEVAAVELINIFRPTVAVARFIAFAAHALYHYPESRRYIDSAIDAEAELFVQEVRRFYPFFPFIGGRVREPFDWHGHHLESGTWVMLDVYGTDRDQRLWTNPGAFQPERFRDWDGSAFNFIPQGGGNHFTTHRCAGE
jgi:fatty-acid peroxygenase